MAASAGQSIAATSLFSATDADNDALSYYLLVSNSAVNCGYFCVDGTGVLHSFPTRRSSDLLAQTSFVAGAKGVTDDLYVLATDGTALSGDHKSTRQNTSHLGHSYALSFS